MHFFKLLTFFGLMALASTLVAQPYSYQYDDETDPDYVGDDSTSQVKIKVVEDFEALGRLARDQNKVIFLEVSASYCGYCRTLEEHIIRPMILSGEYSDYVLIRKINVDSFYPIKDFNGKLTNPGQFASNRKVWVTPTLLFLGPDGQQVSDPIVGVNTLELYAEYVNIALADGHRKIVR
jgi:thiol-disulfide isomerase/thioredoxin